MYVGSQYTLSSYVPRQPYSQNPFPANHIALTVPPASSGNVQAAALPFQFVVPPPPLATSCNTPSSFTPFIDSISTSFQRPTSQSGYEIYRKLYDLPEFSGDPEEWPVFLSTFNESTATYGYNNRENTMRLRKSLKGDAREVVRSLLIHTDNVNEVISQLEFRFGRADILVDDQLLKMRNIRPISEHDILDIVPYATKVQNLASVLTFTNSHQHLVNPMLIGELVSKLPMRYKMDWANYSMTIQPYPTVKHLSAWLNQLARLAALAKTTVTIAPTPSMEQFRDSKPARTKRVLLNAPEPSSATSQDNCRYCGKTHSLADCRNFTKLSSDEKWTEVKKFRLCFCCLKGNHTSRTCRSKRSCGINGCTRIHHRILHEGVQTDINNKEVPQAAGSTPNCYHAKMNSCDKPKLMFRIVPVKLFGVDAEADTFALLDEGSSVTMLDVSLAKQLNLQGETNPLTLQWFGNTTTTEPSMSVNLQVSGKGSDAKKFSLCNVYTVRNINLPLQTLNLIELHSRYHHLKNLPICDYSDAKPQILIGVDNCHLGVPVHSTDCGPAGPVVAKTKLGYVVYGPMYPADTVGHHRAHALHCTKGAKQQDGYLHDLVEDYLCNESLDVKTPEQAIQSAAELRASSILSETTTRIGKRFQSGLLWKSDNITLPNSEEMATRRLVAIEKKMSRDASFAASYNQIIDDYLRKGYARKLSLEESSRRGPRTWYLPHFAVHNPNKPGKIRLVFDAAARVNGVSLNSHLLAGPDQYRPLTAVLFNFRLGKVGVCGDIREMFHQVNIQTSDQDSQRFLWRSGDTTKSPDTFVMVAMTFGATCSPAIAQYVKNTNALQFESKHPRAVESIVDHHYVDDLVDSFGSVDEAVAVARAVRSIHAHGGFEIRNFKSNSKEVLQAIAGSCDENEPFVINTHKGTGINLDKILGMIWDTKEDVLTFRLHFHRIDKEVLARKRHPTKRELLSIVMSIFDPLGILANILIHGKILLQELWAAGTDWDESIPDVLHTQWSQWQNELENVNRLRIPRCYSQYLSIADAQLHIFVDASESACAAVGFWRVAMPGKATEVVFITGKTKCAPRKLMSIPRLELQAAVLGTRLRRCIAENHATIVQRCVFWSDSRTVLAWINSDHRRYKPFVAHRISEILENSNMTDWRWIPTKLNAADDATRAKFPAHFNENSQWVQGPAFLREDELNWPHTLPTIEDMSEELRPKFRTLHITNASMPILINVSRFSNYFRLLRAMAWTYRAVRLFSSRLKPDQSPPPKRELLPAELKNAEMFLCRQAQAEAFADEIATLKRGRYVDKPSAIYQLTPYLGQDDVIRVSGRIDNASAVSMATRKPIILPKDSRLTKLIVSAYHRKWCHQNEATIVSEIRRKFWIPNLRQVVKRAKRDCTLCKRRLAQPQTPLMGQLPHDRLAPYVRPFSYTGLDFFGPLFVAIGRRREKRWVALFTCMTVRAVHLEIAANLSTDACLLCIRNFVNRRGIPVRIRSDNGTNFVGAQRELERVEDFFDHDRIRAELSPRGVEWIFNCPSNPSEGGCWERLVRSVKRVLSFTLQEEAPRLETLHSLLIEAENIVNSRPLTHLPVEVTEEDPLTPNHFLIGTMNSTQTPGPCEDKLWCLRKQWRIAQQLKNRFWKRWVAEYLPTLTRRTKWHKRTEPIKPDDLVLICEVELPRSQWRRGRIVRVYPGRDGQVRTADVQTVGGVLRRPASKLAVLDIRNGESDGVDSRRWSVSN